MSASPLSFDCDWTELEAAKFLGLSADTLRGWRNQTRDRGELVGPQWLEYGHGKRKIVRYEPQVVAAYKASCRIQYRPKRSVGRPRKAETAAAVAAL